ncbi:MAG: hypothetical protein AAF432_02600 [Planctomycetota bacterium]
MKKSRIGTWTILYGVLVFAVVGIVMWTSYNEHMAIRAEILDLEGKMRGLSGHTSELERLAVEVRAIEDRMTSDLKEIPMSADVATIIGRLSLPVDGDTVVDQTFTAGSESPAVVGEDTPLRVMPVTVDMDATFESVFTVLRAAESTRRLIRVASLRLSFPRDREHENVTLPRVKASIGLEAVYDPIEGESSS